MKVIHVTASPLSLGFLRAQAGFMAVHEIELEFVSSPGEALEAFGRSEGVPVHPVPMSRSVTPLRDLRSLGRLVRLFRELRPDLVHAHTPKAGLLGMLAAAAAGVERRVYHLRGMPATTARRPVRELLLGSDRLACSLAHRVLAVSHSLREEVIASGLCPDGKITVIGRGSGQGVDAGRRFQPSRFPPEKRRALRARWGIGTEDVVVGFVGRLALDKGLAELWEAWEVLSQRHQPLRLLLVGAQDARAPLPVNLHRLFSADDRVHELGWIQDVAEAYAVMDILALPTHREGFPNVLLEAAAMEVPVVASCVTGCVDAVVTGETGVLVPAGRSGSLGDALEQYITEPERRRQHGRAGRARVVEHFSPEQIWQGILTEYEALARRRPPSRF